jgi:hypothetical protein
MQNLPRGQGPGYTVKKVIDLNQGTCPLSVYKFTKIRAMMVTTMDSLSFNFNFSPKKMVLASVINVMLPAL